MTIDGIEDAKRRLGRLPDNADRLGTVVVRNNAQRVVAAARAHAPVRRGFLRSSIEFYAASSAPVAGLQIGPLGAHWFYLEYGTHKMPAHPFVFPAIEGDRPRLDSDMTAAATRAADEM